MKTALKIIAHISILLTLLTGCGKNPSEEERVKDSLRATAQEKEALLAPLVGRYEGTLTFPNGEKQKIALQLISTIMIVQNPGRNDVTEMPTLGGNINIYFNAEDKTDVIPIAQFTNSMYSADSHHLRLNGSIQTGTSIGTVLNTFDGYVRGQQIQGNLSNTSRGDLGFVDVTRTSTEETNK